MNSWTDQKIKCSLHFRSGHQRSSVKNNVHKNFTKFTEKYLCQVSFLTKLQAWGSNTGVFLKILQNLWEHLQNTSGWVLLIFIKCCVPSHAVAQLKFGLALFWSSQMKRKKTNSGNICNLKWKSKKDAKGIGTEGASCLLRHCESVKIDATYAIVFELMKAIINIPKKHLNIWFFFFILPEKFLLFLRYSNFCTFPSPLFSHVGHYWIYKRGWLKINTSVCDLIICLNWNWKTQIV